MIEKRANIGYSAGTEGFWGVCQDEIKDILSTGGDVNQLIYVVHLHDPGEVVIKSFNSHVSTSLGKLKSPMKINEW